MSFEAYVESLKYGPPEAPKAGKVYAVNHSRKGRFVALVDSVDCARAGDEWATVTIIEGKARMLSAMNQDAVAGESLTIRLSLCDFCPVCP